VFSSYLILEWERRQQNDERSLGGLYYVNQKESPPMLVICGYTTAKQVLMATAAPKAFPPFVKSDFLPLRQDNEG
jgi:hypothetical protein